MKYYTFQIEIIEHLQHVSSASVFIGLRHGAALLFQTGTGKQQDPVWITHNKHTQV